MPRGQKCGGLQAAPPRFKPCVTCGVQMSDCLVSKKGEPYRLRVAAWEARQACSRACKVMPSAPAQFKTCAACGKTYSDVRRLNGAGQSGRVTPGKWALSRWCSTKCRWVTQKALVVTKVCKQCGKTFDNKVRAGIKAGSFVNSQRFAARNVCSNVCGLRYRQHRTTAQAFADNCGEKQPNGCIPWVGHRAKFGHGRIVLKDIGGKSILAHRLAYALHKGPVPGDRIVCHDCNNASCVNADHLYLGDYKTNAADRYGLERPQPKAIKARHPDVHIDDAGKLCLRRTTDR